MWQQFNIFSLKLSLFQSTGAAKYTDYISVER